MGSENTNWQQSVTAVVIKDGKVLLARHTYGRGKGKLIIPGGYVENGESPQQAVVREFIEETNVTIKPNKIIGIRFNSKDWYVAFSADYVSGKEQSDNHENNEVVWLNVDEALQRDDVPYLTKVLIKSALKQDGLSQQEYEGFNFPCSFYSM
jgi:ADP-ribose pyrophosphatase YjhB (NUDIX family)